jgi:peptidoglycan/LPS O-acetylase OafA/YrhL
MQRNNTIDFLRAASIVYIVGFWHLQGYSVLADIHKTEATYQFTVAVLGLFVFLSGWLLGGKRLPGGWAGIGDFLRSRLKRIYPLFLLTLVLFVLVRISDVPTAAKAAVLLSMFWGPAPMTLWFITMLFLFYLVAPFLIRTVERPVGFVVLCAAIFGCFAAAVALPEGDPRVALYFPAFVLGIVLSRREGALDSPRFLGAAMVALGAAVALAWWDDAPAESSLYSIPLASLGAICIFGLFRRLPDLGASALVQQIAYCSFAMYLLHRPVYKALKRVWFPETAAGQMATLYVYFLVLVVVAWVVQVGYDRLLQRMAAPRHGNPALKGASR